MLQNTHIVTIKTTKETIKAIVLGNTLTFQHKEISSRIYFCRADNSVVLLREETTRTSIKYYLKVVRIDRDDIMMPVEVQP